MRSTRIQIDRILCPVDFSEFSAPALERALWLAARFGARLEVLHVVPFGVPSGAGLPYSPGAFAVNRTRQQYAEDGIASLVAPLLGEGVPILTKVLAGDPWRVIREEAEGFPADLLVMGTHGRSGFERFLLGSVTEKLLRRAPCPVLTVGHVPHPRTGPLFRRILCAADLTLASERTLEVSLSLAAENDGQITLLHVTGTLPGDTGSELYPSGPEIDAWRRELAAQARARLRAATAGVVRSFCEVAERVETGVPWSEILRVANQMDADLIVMGAHTGGAIGRVLFGSTANQVVRRATCPVLVIHDTKSKQPQRRAEQVKGAAHSHGLHG